MSEGTSELGKYIRTPEERFEDLPGFGYAPKYLDYRGLRIHYLDEGPKDGKPVLLLHGEPSWCYLYRKMIPAIVGAGHRAIAPDLVGFGRSDKLLQRRDYSYQLQVDYIKWFIRELSLSDISMFCQDWGGLVGLRVAAEEEASFARVAIGNTALPGRVPDKGRFASIAPSAFFGFPVWLGFSQLAPVLPVGMILQFGTVTRLDKDVVAAYDAPFPDRRYKAGARSYPALVFSQLKENSAAWEKLAKWEKPFLTLFSDKDVVLGGGDKVFQEVVPGAKGRPHRTVRGGGHFLQEDKGEELGEIMVEFMAEG